jgi:hypothetical protein
MHVQNLLRREQRLLDQCTEGAYHDHLRLSLRDPLYDRQLVHALGLLKRDLKAPGPLGNGWRGESAAPAPRAIGATQNQRGTVIAGGQPLEYGSGEIRRAKEDGAQDRNPAANRR